jgi:antitoxin VapB
MGDTAKLFMNGRSQAVRLPKAYRFEGTEVSVRRDGEKSCWSRWSKSLPTLMHG